MLSFIREINYTGFEVRESKKSGQAYTLLNFLGEDGKSFSAMYKGDDFDFSTLKQLDLVTVHFKLSQYNRDLNLSVVEIVI